MKPALEPEPACFLEINLSDAIDGWKADPTRTRERRTHLHVPVFLDSLGDFRTTRPGVDAALRVHAEAALSDHLEIAAYTRDVLPDRLKTGDITDCVAHELDG